MSNFACFGVPRVNVAPSSTWRETWKTKGTLHGKIEDFSAGRCNFSFQQHADIIPTATTTFFFTSDLNMTMSMSPNVVDYGFKMAAIKPEVEITFERFLIARRFQRLPPHFRPLPTLT